MSDKFTYIPQGVCARKMAFELEGEVILDVQIDAGCPGNLLGIKKLIIGKNVNEVIEAFSGVKCGIKSTSCPEQIAIALSKHFQ